MMAALPFSQVAILSPTHVFSFPAAPTCDRQMVGELRMWLAQALARGADAVYARVQLMPAGLDVVRALQDLGAPLLAPASLYAADVLPLAWHYTAAEAAAASEHENAPSSLRGCSCHSLAELELAERRGFDYAFLSPIFGTATHPGAVPLGLDVLAAACAGVRMPVIALGGVDAVRGSACREAGAAGWAGIGAWM